MKILTKCFHVSPDSKYLPYLKWHFQCEASLTTIMRKRNLGGGAAWKIPRIQNVLEHEFLHFPDRKWLESYHISKDMFQQSTCDLQDLQRQVTRLHNPVPVRTIVAMLLKRIGKQLDYREMRDKFGIGTSTACMKVNEAMRLLVSSNIHIISKLQRGIDFQRMINGFQRKWNFPQCLGAIDGTHIPIKAPLVHHADYFNRKSFHFCDSASSLWQHMLLYWRVWWLAWSSTWCEGVWSLSDRQADNRGKIDTRWFKFVSGYW